MSETFLVTAALPYANGPIHLGHIAGAYLPADIFVRFNRLIGNTVVFICGTDEHGVPITLSAEKENVTPRAIVKRYHENIKQAFARLNIQFDHFSGTSNIHNPHHAYLSRDFFVALLRKDLLVARLSDQHYCTQCSRFLPDRFVEGTCPRCGYEEARGDECSRCNAQFEQLELGHPRCKICSQTPEVQKTKHWYLRLDRLQNDLETWLKTNPHWKDNVLNFAMGWVKTGLKERAITRDLYWGVPVPLEEAMGKVIYVWFEAPIGYISATIDWAKKIGEPERWKDYWQNPQSKVVHFIGKDNIPFHAVLWPAMLLGVGNYNLPWDIPANEYLTFGIGKEEAGVKGSKSKGNVVWVHETLDLFDADQVRFHLAACAPERSDTHFTWKEFQSKCNGELLGVLGNLANRVLKFTVEHAQGKVPTPQNLSERDRQFLQTIRETPERVRSLYAHYEVRNAIAEIVALGRLGNQYFDEKAPWRSVKENPIDCTNTLYVSAQLVKTIAVLLHPCIPASTNRLWQQLGLSGEIQSWNQATEEIPPGHTLGNPQGIFKKIEDQIIADLTAVVKPPASAPCPPTPTVLDDLTAAVPPPTSTPCPPTPTAPPSKKEPITLEEFSRLDIRMGEILEAEPIKKSDKLLKLKVRLGDEERILVSGIAQYYKPEELKGKKVPVLANLEPAKIRGQMSQGMILCADGGDRPFLLLPDQDIPSGGIVH